MTDLMSSRWTPFMFCKLIGSFIEKCLVRSVLILSCPFIGCTGSFEEAYRELRANLSRVLGTSKFPTGSYEEIR